MRLLQDATTVNCPAAVANVGGIVANLALNEGIRPQLMQMEVVLPLLKLCDVATETGVLSTCTRAIANLCQNVGITVALVKNGAIRSIIRLCEQSIDDTG